jgi:hypothetical protein
MRDLADIHYPDAERIRVVLDNLSTHSPAALYQVLPPSEARRILRRLEFYYMPKHASWLNMVKIEIGVLRGQCLDRRIESRDRLLPRSPLGNISETKAAPTSTGCSPPSRPASNSPKPTQRRPPKSHNPCAEILGNIHQGKRRLRVIVHIIYVR